MSSQRRHGNERPGGWTSRSPRAPRRGQARAPVRGHDRERRRGSVEQQATPEDGHPEPDEDGRPPPVRPASSSSNGGGGKSVVTSTCALSEASTRRRSAAVGRSAARAARKSARASSLRSGIRYATPRRSPAQPNEIDDPAMGRIRMPVSARRMSGRDVPRTRSSPGSDFWAATPSENLPANVMNDT